MKKIFIILFALSNWVTHSQIPTGREAQLESLSGEEDEADFQQLAENLEDLSSQKILINFAGSEDFLRLHLLNEFQIYNVIQYRISSGVIYSHYELQSIKGFDKELINRLLPYLDFSTEKTYPDLKVGNIAKYSQHQILLRANQTIQDRAAYSNQSSTSYDGSPTALYFRYKGNYRNLISWGFNFQKDAGEAWGGDSRPLFADFLGGHIALKNYGNIKKLVIGDYHLAFGQGLALCSSLALGKSAEAISVKRFANGIIPYSGAEENRIFRGIGATYRLWEKLDISGFYSRNKVDANLNAEDGISSVSSLQYSGLHRTPSEVENHNSLNIESYGSNLNFKTNNFSIGLTAVRHRFSLPIIPPPDLYRRFSISGTEQSNVSSDFNFLFRDLNFFGELAFDQGGHPAYCIGFQSNPADGLYLSFFHRNLHYKYNSLYNAPFGEWKKPGESGNYLGAQYEIFSFLTLNTYVDIYENNWYRYQVNLPIRGRDISIQSHFKVSHFFNFYVRYKREITQSEDQSDFIAGYSYASQSAYRIHAEYSLSPNLSIASRLQFSELENQSKSQGQIMYQDIRYSFPSIPLELKLRYAQIDTDDFTTRIYTYENDLTYSFSMVPYYGKCNRIYLLASYGEKLRFQIKVAHTTFQDRKTISSGPNEISGNSQTDIRGQLVFKF